MRDRVERPRAKTQALLSETGQILPIRRPDGGARILLVRMRLQMEPRLQPGLGISGIATILGEHDLEISRSSFRNPCRLLDHVDGWRNVPIPVVVDVRVR